MEIGFITAVLSSGVRLAVPTFFAAIGELVAERAGVLNLGLEGMMIAGAFSGFAVAESTGSASVGIAAGALAGASLGLMMVVVAIKGGGNQIVAGFSLTILGLGATGFFHDQWRESLSSISPLPRISVPLLSDLPVIGPVLFRQNLLFYFAAFLLAVIHWVFSRTRIGLEVTAVGHDPVSARAKGVAVVWVRSLSTVFAGLCAGVGGAAISVGVLGSFGPGMTAGRGFVAIAIVIVGRWKPMWTGLIALVFGLSEALQLRLQNLVDVPVQLLAALPWIVMLVLLIAGGREATPPRMLGREVVLER